MCGRFTLRATASQLTDLFAQAGILLNDVPDSLAPRYNIAPSQPLLTVRARPGSGKMETTFLSWGLVPFWAKDPKIGYKMINARSETAAEKPSFRAAYKYRRALVPADGFYEWKKQSGGKQPYLIGLAGENGANGGLFCFAALWERWERDGSAIESCTLLTTAPNERLADIHNRMPVILHPEAYQTWLDPMNQRGEGLGELLQPFPAEQMGAYPVSTLVNNPRNEDPDCVVPLA